MFSSSIYPYVIAEIGVNHEGSLEKALEMVRSAANAGANAVKFQTYKASTLASKNSPAYWDQSKEPTTSQYKLFQKYDGFGQQDYEVLKNACDQCGVDFMSTPFDVQCLEWLMPLMDIVKIASADLTNNLLLEAVGDYGKPVILSVGASSIKEIWDAIGVLEESGCNDISLLHCMLLYPTNLEDAHLSRILELREEFSSKNIRIGYSDHVPPGAADNDQLIIACAMGASIIEKHYTFDKELPGNDHYHAMDSDDLGKLTDRFLKFKMMTTEISQDGLLEKQISANKNARRSLVYITDLKSGHIIEKSDLMAKRPGTGISVKEYKTLIGLTLSSDVQADDLVSRKDFKGKTASYL
jgi:sialic acid synthase SpsE